MENHADGWKAYKAPRHLFDEELVAVLDRFVAHGAPNDARTLVLNGDIVDFDLVHATPAEPAWPVSAGERRHGLEPTGPKSAWKLARILDDHRCFLGSIAGLLAAGHRVIYVYGNHDRELCFEEVRDVFVAAVARAGEETGVAPDLSRLHFEPWFFYEPGRIFAEHGQQYDYYTSFRYVLAPTLDDGAEPILALPMGNLSNRRLITHMGYFNPHASDYILNVYSYFAHWLRHYAFSRNRHMGLRWVFGSLGVMISLLQTKRRLRRAPPNYDVALRKYAERAGVSEATLRALDELKRLPITTRWYRVFREFWLDRVLAGILFTGGTIALAVSPVPLWIKLMVPITSFPLLFLIYESLVRVESVFTAEQQASKYARAISELFDARVITFGHTHQPKLLPLEPGVTYVNTGTWAPMGPGADVGQRVPGMRNALTVTFDGDAMTVHLSSEG